MYTISQTHTLPLFSRPVLQWRSCSNQERGLPHWPRCAAAFGAGPGEGWHSTLGAEHRGQQVGGGGDLLEALMPSISPVLAHIWYTYALGAEDCGQHGQQVGQGVTFLGLCPWTRGGGRGDLPKALCTSKFLYKPFFFLTYDTLVDSRWGKGEDIQKLESLIYPPPPCISSI